jgi:hypothetical protein
MQGKKHCGKALMKVQDDENVYLAQMKVLKNFVKERLDATCTFDFIPVSNSQDFVGRVSRFMIFMKIFTTTQFYLCPITYSSSITLFQIIIQRDQMLLFELQGEPMPSKYKAMSMATVKMYQYLTSTLANYGIIFWLVLY